MSEFSNDPIVPNESPTSFFQTWMTALTKPNEQTYADLAASPEAKASKAYLWVFVTSFATYVAAMIVQLISGAVFAGQTEGLMEAMSVFAVVLICAAPIGAGLSVLGLMISTAIIQWIAGMFGGTGDYNRMVYVLGAIAAPLSLVSAVITLFSVIPFIGILFGLVGIAVVIYAVALNIMAVKGVNQFGWGQAAGSVLIPGFVIVFLFACLVIGGLMLLGPAIGDVFSEINQGLVP